jgi:hypothetical protein
MFWTCPNSPHCKFSDCIEPVISTLGTGRIDSRGPKGCLTKSSVQMVLQSNQAFEWQEQDGPSQTSLALAILETWLHTPISCTCHSECALMYAWLDICDTHNCRACKHIFFQPDHIRGN